MSPIATSAIAISGGAAAIGVGLVFAAAGIAKLRNRRVFPGVVANYRLLPDALVGPVAFALPFAELVSGIALIAGAGFFAVPVIALLLLFAAAMAINIGRGRSHIDCGCGRSELRQPLSRMLVLRNIGLALVLVPTLLATPKFGSVEWLIALAGGIALFLLTQLVNTLAALAKGPLATGALANGPLASMERNSR